MEATTGRIFRPYFVMSTLCAVICLYHLWQDPYWKSRSFLDRIKLSRIGTAILGNMTFASLLLFYKGVLYLFFGPITLAETQKMWQRLVNYMVFNLLAVSAILDPRMDVVLKWGSWLFLMASMRLMCDLARNRFKVLITYTPNAAWWIHGKIVMLLCLLMMADVAVFSWAMHIRDEFTKDQLFLVVSECFSLSVVAMGALIKYLIYYIDMIHFSGQWDHRGSYSYYTDLFSKSIILMVSLIYYATILHLHGVSLNIFFDILIIIRLVVIVVSLRTKFIAYQNYRQLSNQIATMYKPLGPQEIEQYNDSCAICRDPMTSALRLPCGHIFHTPCLRSWLEHNHNCPTCRFALIPQNPAPRPSNPARPRPSNTNPVPIPSPNPIMAQVRTHSGLEARSDANRESPTLSRSSHHVAPNTTENAIEGVQMSSSAPRAPQAIFDTSNATQSRNGPTARTGSSTSQRPSTPQPRRTVTSSSEALSRHEELNPAPHSVWSFSSPSWLAWLPSLSVEVVRGQDPGIGHMDQKDLGVHREHLEQVRLLFPDIPESIALADLIATRSVQETINNIIENRLSWSPNGTSSPTVQSAVPSAHTNLVSSSNRDEPANLTSSPLPLPIQGPQPRHSNFASSSSLAASSAPAQRSPLRTSPPVAATTSTPNTASPARSRLVQSSPTQASSSSAPTSKSTTPSPAAYQERKRAMIEACREAYLRKLNQ
jgi:autocrine motility factor receptor